jgi:alkyldihydroxyacetonephosphate synthase
MQLERPVDVGGARTQPIFAFRARSRDDERDRGQEQRVDELAAVRARDGQRSATGWGFVGEEPTADEIERLRALLALRFPDAPAEHRPPAPPDDAAVPAPRLAVPAPLADRCTTDPAARRLHARGQSYVDTVRAARGEIDRFPDVVAVPRDAAEVAAVLDWCADAGAACIPFGGGTSVVGGVTPAGLDRPVVTLQTRAMDRVVEVDRASRAALVEAGASGPVLEAQLRPHDLTLRFFPQSFELSTVGGWIATRAGGHFATRLTHIDDLVESVDAVTPAGTWSSRRLPGSGAGPSPDRLLLGSEGTLGVVTRAWLRLQDRPVHRASAVVSFPDLLAAAAAVRAVLQAGLGPANCRVLDATEALLNGAGDGSAAVLLLGFESAHHPVEADARLALDVCTELGGRAPEGLKVTAGGPAEDAGPDAAGAWKRSFVRAPYLRDALVGLGFLSETFETAVTWDRLPELHARVTAATTDALAEVCGDGIVTCRITHAYPDGAAPYFTVIAPGRPGAEIAQWSEVKAAASEALLAAGGTITHHHAVGRDHRPWYDRQRPEPFAAALRAAKGALDPAGVLNPGVLIG